MRRLGMVAPRLTLAAICLLVIVRWDWLLEDPSQVLKMAILGWAVLLTVLIHELAHYVVGSALGLHDLVIRVGLIGGYVGPADGKTDLFAQLSPRERVLFAAAGPTANLATFALLSVVSVADWVSLDASNLLSLALRLVCSFSLVMGLLNLIPVSMLDGGRIVQAALSTLSSPAQALSMHLYRIFSAATCAVVLTHAVLSDRSWGWNLWDGLVLAALALLTLAVELPEGTGEPRPTRPSRTYRALARRPLLSAATAGVAGGALGRIVGVLLYGT